MFRKSKVIINKNNNIVFIYYFKRYYRKHKYNGIKKILDDINNNINNEPLISNTKIRYIIMYPEKYSNQLRNINLNIESDKIIFMNDYNKSIIGHLIYY